MLSVYNCKPAFQICLRPAVRVLASHGVSPNQVTFGAMILSGLQGGAIALFPTDRWSLLLLPVVVFLRMALNAIDGLLAKEHGMQSRLGAALNEVGDVASDAALYLPLALIPGLPATSVVSFTVLGIISEVAGLAGASDGALRHYTGPMGKSDRAVLVGALSLVLGMGVPPGQWLDILFAAAVALSLLTVMTRVFKAAKPRII